MTINKLSFIVIEKLEKESYCKALYIFTLQFQLICSNNDSYGNKNKYTATTTHTDSKKEERKRKKKWGKSKKRMRKRKGKKTKNRREDIKLKNKKMRILPHISFCIPIFLFVLVVTMTLKAITKALITRTMMINYSKLISWMKWSKMKSK